MHTATSHTHTGGAPKTAAWSLGANVLYTLSGLAHLRWQRFLFRCSAITMFWWQMVLFEITECMCVFSYLYFIFNVCVATVFLGGRGFEYCLGVMIYLLARRLQRSHCPSQATPTLFALTEINGRDKILHILISRIMNHTKTMTIKLSQHLWKHWRV